MKWQKLANGKWRPIREPHDKMNIKDPDFERRRMSKLRKLFLYCDICHEKYSLADPCIHHLSDSPDHAEKYKRHKALLKKSGEPKQDETQQRF